MNLLLDTHAFVWWTEDDGRLPVSVRRVVEDVGVGVAVSVVTLWEMVLKTRGGRFRSTRSMPEVLSVLRDWGFRVLPIGPQHVVRVADLPLLHGDPFDRMLVAQALEEGLTLVSGDRRIAGYPVDVLWD